MFALLSKRCLVTISPILIVIGITYTSTWAEENTLEIAFAGPLSGTEEARGESMVRAIELYLQQVNDAGDIPGKKLVLTKFDDASNAEQGYKNASVITASEALTVVGHYYSSVSIKAGEIYQQEGIPAVSPGATSPLLTPNNDWYFRTIYNDALPARFSAKYIQEIFQEDTVTIISDDDSYGQLIGDEFRENAERLGLNIAYHHVFPRSHPDLPKHWDQIVAELQELDKLGVIFIGTYAKQASKMLG